MEIPDAKLTLLIAQAVMFISGVLCSYAFALGFKK